jgi:hypothetical protein
MAEARRKHASGRTSPDDYVIKLLSYISDSVGHMFSFLYFASQSELRLKVSRA